MPISRPWTVTIRQCKRLIQATCQPAVSRPWIKGICCASVLPSLDAGFRHPCRKDGPPTLVYNDERSRVGMQTLPLLRFDISDAGASPEAFPRRAWERSNDNGQTPTYGGTVHGSALRPYSQPFNSLSEASLINSIWFKLNQPSSSLISQIEFGLTSLRNLIQQVDASIFIIGKRGIHALTYIYLLL